MRRMPDQNRLLEYDWLYKMTDTLVRTSNAFAVIFYNEDYTEVTRIQPVTVRNHRIFEDDAGNLLFRFVWDFDGQEYTVPYQFVIHLKSRYNKKRFLDTSPDSELHCSTELLETTYRRHCKILFRVRSKDGGMWFEPDKRALERYFRRWRMAVG